MNTLYFKKDICTRADVRLDSYILFTLDIKISPLESNSFILKGKNK